MDAWKYASLVMLLAFGEAVAAETNDYFECKLSLKQQIFTGPAAKANPTSTFKCEKADFSCDTQRIDRAALKPDGGFYVINNQNGNMSQSGSISRSSGRYTFTATQILGNPPDGNVITYRQEGICELKTEKLKF